MTVKNTFRAGSTCHRAFHHLERAGRCTTAQLAKALEFDEDELPGLLGLALRSGHIRRTGDLWEIGDGTPAPTAATPPAPPAPPPIKTATVPPAVLDIPPAPSKRPAPAPAPAPATSTKAAPKAPAPRVPPPAPPQPPAAAPVAAQAPAPAAAPPAAPAAPAPAAPPVAEADHVRITKPLATVRPPAESPPPAAPPEPPPRDAPPKATVEDEKNRRMTAMLWNVAPHHALPPEGAVEGVMARAARLQEAITTWPEGRVTERMCAAWCSDGTYVIEKAGGRLELDLSEVVELWDHLRTVMAGTAELAAAHHAGHAGRRSHRRACALGSTGRRCCPRTWCTRRTSP